MSGTFAISWGDNGGFYLIRHSSVWRICLWRVAITFVKNIEIDRMMEAYAEQVWPPRGREER